MLSFFIRPVSSLLKSAQPTPLDVGFSHVVGDEQSQLPNLSRFARELLSMPGISEFRGRFHSEERFTSKSMHTNVPSGVWSRAGSQSDLGWYDMAQRSRVTILFVMTAE